MAGERQISVIETQSKTSGFVEAAAQANALDAAFDAVTESSRELTRAEINLESSVGRLDAKFNETVRTANEVAKAQETIARARAQGVGTEEQYARILTGVTQRHEAALARQTTGMKQVGAAANDNARTFGLAGHQVQNLTFQLNDLATQIASGGGIFRPLIQQGGQVFQVLQMSEGGVGGVLKNVGASLARIGPLALTAFGAAGVAGAVALAANALSNFQENLKRAEASVRSLTDSSAQANKVLAGAAEAAKGTRLLAEDLQQVRLQAETLSNTSSRITELANGLKGLAPALNAQAFTQGVANIVSGMGASREEMQKMIAAVLDLGGKMTITAGEAQKLAYRFPELAKLLAQAFGTTPQGLLQLPKQFEISTTRLEEFITAAGKTKDASDGVLNFTDSITRLVASIDNLFGLSKGWDFFWGNVAKGANIAADAIDKFLGRSAQAAKAPAPQAPQAPPRSTAQDPKATSDYYSRNIQGGRDISQTGEKTLREIHEGNIARRAAEEKAQEDAKAAQAGLSNVGEATRTADQANQNALRPLDRIDDTLKDMAADSKGFNWASQGALDAFGNELDVNRNKVSSFGNATDRASSSLSKLSEAATTLSSRGPMTSSSPGAMNFSQPIYGYMVSDYDEANKVLLEHYTQQYMSEIFGSLSATDARRKAIMDMKAASTGGGIRYFDAEAELAKLDDLGDAAQSAADKLDTIDISSLGQPIEAKIDTLRGLQEAALSRAYRPDPYAEKNPEFFYNGEKIMKEAQDKIYDGLQAQIVKLESLQASLGTLVQQNAQLPQTLVDALIAAGFANVAEKIVAAFRTSATPSATPNPTAVQQSMPSVGSTYTGVRSGGGNWTSSGL
jgi:tape measure domain-containing protein